jgi:hypothetical protein
MSYYTIGAFLIIALSVVCLLSWEIIYTKGLWYMKVLSTLAVILLVFFSIHTWQSIQGTPKYLDNAEGLIVRSYMIKEPKHNQKGKIWLWVTDPAKEEPYNIEIPYTEDTHKKLMENKGLSEGRPQIIKRKGKENNTTPNTNQYIFEDIIKFVPKDSN